MPWDWVLKIINMATYEKNRNKRKRQVCTSYWCITFKSKPMRPFVSVFCFSPSFYFPLAPFSFLRGSGIITHATGKITYWMACQVEGKPPRWESLQGKLNVSWYCLFVWFVIMCLSRLVEKLWEKVWSNVRFVRINVFRNFEFSRSRVLFLGYCVL